MIEAVTNDNLKEILPLITEYQQFYGIENNDIKKNKSFFSQFTESNENGILHLYRENNKAVGFTTIYKGFSSTRAEAVAILNDLYVQPSSRGKGVAKALIDNALISAKKMGFSRLQWLTAEDNKKAQPLYDNLDASKSSWLFYAKVT